MVKPIFDMDILLKKRIRSAPYWSKADFLWTYMAKNICERVHDTLRDYDQALDVGTRMLYVPRAFKGSNKVKNWDTQEAFTLKEPYQASIISPSPQFKKEYYDLITNSLNMHNINDIQGELNLYNASLKSGGLLIASFFGEDNLIELRQALYKAETEVLGGVSPRISPTITLKDAGNLLFMANFKLPVADKEIFTINYETPLKFLKDIQHMGESNSLINKLKIPRKPKKFITTLLDKLQEVAGNNDGSISITCEIITITGWKSDGSMDPKTNPHERIL